MVLKLARLSIPKKIEKARFIVTSMTGNANFTTPNPALTVITADANALETAHLGAEGGGKDETALMYSKEEALDKDLSTLAAYLRSISNNNPTAAEAVALSSGMDIKSPTPHAARTFSVQNSKTPGEVNLRTQSGGRRVSYIWQMTADPSNEANWKTIQTTVKTKITVSGLISGTRYYFRAATVNKDGQGPWSNVLTIIVQ